MPSILELLKAERDRLDRAIAILEGGANHVGRRGGARRVLSAGGQGQHHQGPESALGEVAQGTSEEVMGNSDD